MGMRFTSGISDAVNARVAADAACRQVSAQLAGAPCDLLTIFASASYRTEWPALLAYIHDRLRPRVLIGCNGSGIIGGAQEFEWVPALSIVAAHLPGVRLYPFAVSSEEVERSSPGGYWIDTIGPAPQDRPVFILFAEPLTCDATKLVKTLNVTYPSCPIVGGLVSGGSKVGDHLLFMNREVRQEGAVGVAMTGNITLDTIVAQGCRPIGRPYIVTRADDNVIYELAGRQALSVLHDVLSKLSTQDRELAQQGSMFLGLVLNEMRHPFGPGDFLIRNLVGIDPGSGALAISDHVQRGQTIQFHLRDAETSRTELRRLVTQWGKARGTTPAGALLFNCIGRGQALYGTAHHDVKTILTLGGNLPIGGFFCNGEIGPIGGVNFLHGYTASLGLFRPSHDEASAFPPASD